MMEQTTAVIILATIIMIMKPNFAQITRRYYIKPDVCGDEYNSTDTSMYLNWSTIQHNISRYFTSHTDVFFLSGEYNLHNQLTVTDAENFTITGRAEVTLKCTNEAGVFINNSMSVRIQNVKLVNCGINTISATPHNFKAAISLLNVQSIVLSNITFEDSLGHGIVGINVLGLSVLKNITIYHKKNNNDINNLSYESSMSGLILVYVDTIDNIIDTEAENAVLVDQCTICCMSDYPSSVQSNVSIAPATSDIFSFSLIGLSLHQHTYSVNVEIVNIVMTNIASQNTSLVYFEYNSSMANSVSIYNSRFTNITSKKIPIVSFMVTSQHGSNSTALFQINNCIFQHNTAIVTKFYKQALAGMPSLMVRFEVISTVVTQSNAIGSFGKWEVSSSDKSTSVAIENCLFQSNTGQIFQFKNIANVTLTNSKFHNNTVKHSRQRLFVCGTTVVIFKQYNEFSYNTADTIITLQKYILLTEGATLNISQNRVKSNESKENYQPLVFFSTSLSIYPCIFQFISPKGNLDKQFVNNTIINFSVVFSNNQKYTSVFRGTVLHSCYWEPNSAFYDTTPGDVYKRVIQYDTTANIMTRREATFCYCDKATREVDCFKDNFTSTPIYPGQTIPISLVQVPPYKVTGIYPRNDVWSSVFLKSFTPCHLVSYHSQDYWLQFVYKECIQLFYKAYSAETCSAFFTATGDENTLYHYYIGIKKCPLGFEISSGTCMCNKLLQAAFPTLKCDIETLTLNRSARTWIGPSQDGKSILYVEFCISIFCKDKPSKLMINQPDTQCVGNRIGVHCGHCPAKLDAVLGSFKCKKCSNNMVGLLPIFFIAGILLVLSLFVLNLTVVDGKINGFIFYANMSIVSGYYVFPSRNILYTLLSLSNLDLGIETCLYHGMTEYGKTWLQFVFPLYLLCIVGALAITSRYSSRVERLTRKRVIPVIATIFLLSYSKMLLVTAKVLFSYTTVHEIDGDDIKTRLSWSWDSSIPLFGKQFIPLFIISLVVLLIILLPLNFCLIFTKTSYRIKFVCDYLKPYLDAYQAPFKNNHYFYCGIELLVRPISFAIGYTMLDSYKTLAFYGFIIVIFLVYLCALKPFKSNITVVLYISYILNLGCQVLLVLYYNTDTTSTSYAVVFNTILIIALLEFGGTVFYYLYKSHLYKIRKVSVSVAKITMLMHKLQRKCQGNRKKTVSVMRPATNFEQLREELLFSDADY